MKTMFLKFGLLLVFVLFVISCASKPLPIDRGIINPGNIPEENLVTLIINKDISVVRFNNADVNWTNIINGIRYDQIVKIPPGINTFDVRHSDGVSYPNLPIQLIAQLNSSNTYLLNWEKHTMPLLTPTSPPITLITFHVNLFNNNIKGEEVTIQRRQ